MSASRSDAVEPPVQGYVTTSPLSAFDLEGKSALITGASSGIGAQVASTLAAAGSYVVLSGRNQERLNIVAADIERAGGHCVAFTSDLTQRGAIAAMVEQAVASAPSGCLNIVVHSAGIYEPAAFGEIHESSLDRQWNINVRVPFLLTQTALPDLAPGCSIVFISSIDGHVGFAGDTAYAATKGGIDALTRALAMELAGRTIRVNAVAPGFTATPMNKEARQSEAILGPVLRATPAGRLATVDDVAFSVLFLVSDAAAFVTGVILPVDGGYPVSEAQMPSSASRSP